MATAISLFKTVKGVTPIKVGRRRTFVSGLFWQVLPAGKNDKEEARKIARREKERTGQALDVVYLRRHANLVQAAFIVRGGRGRARKGTVSLAAVAADMLGANFVAAFALPDGRYALTGCMEEAIVPDLDQVCDEAEARRRIQEMRSAQGSDTDLQVYAPAHLWPGAKQFELEDLLSGVRLKHRLRQRPTFSGAGASTWILWAVGIAVAAGGWGAWEVHQSRVKKEREALIALEQQRLRQSAALSASDLAAIRPWTTQASAPMFARICTDAIGQVPLTLEGWVLLNAQCSAASVAATFARSEGRTVEGFVHTAQAWRPGLDIQFSSDGDLGTIQWPHTMLAGGDEPLDPMQERTNAFMSWWQARLVPFELKAVNSSFPAGYTPPSNRADPRLTTPHWQTAHWEIKASGRNPSRLMNGLQAHGLRINLVQLAFNEEGKLTWSLKGELYGE